MLLGSGEMSHRPDKILQFAHHLADLEQERTGVRPLVNAGVVASSTLDLFRN
jgi:hypothetical protein